MFSFAFSPIPANWISGETLALRMKSFEVVDIQNEMKCSCPFPLCVSRVCFSQTRPSMSVLDPTSGVMWPDPIRHLSSIYLNISDGHTEARNILEEAEVK